VGNPQVSYRESITQPSRAQGRFVRQTGGHGQYGDVVLELHPGEPGTGIVFNDKTVGGVIPKEFIPAVEDGVREACASGPLGGFEMVDLQANLVDGSYHEVDSSPVAFKIAGSMALKEAARKGAPVLQEPMMAVEVVIPEEYLGDVIGNLNSRRGQVQSLEVNAGSQIVKSLVPLSEMFGYATDLRSRTQGRGNFTMIFSHYSQVPKNIAEKIIGK